LGRIGEYQFILYNYARFFQIFKSLLGKYGNEDGSQNFNQTQTEATNKTTPAHSLFNLFKPEETSIIYDFILPTIYGDFPKNNQSIPTLVNFLKNSSKLLGRYYNRHRIITESKFERPRFELVKLILFCYGKIFDSLRVERVLKM